MSIYHCSIKIGSRGKGQSAVAASAYRSGTKIKDYETGVLSDYTRKSGVIYSEISLCANAPFEYQDREVLWNAVHKIEKASNARLWREIEVALPKELNREEQIETVREYVRGLTDVGMCADWSLHDKGDGNPHAHIMLTTRSIKENGEWASKSRKVYDLDKNGNKIFQKVDNHGRKQYKNHKEDYNNWNDRERVEEWRKAWADCCNKRLAVNQQIDHRSYKRQGIEQEPTIHEGYVARKMVASGEISDRVQMNKEIKLNNAVLIQIAKELEITEKELEKLMAEKEKGSVLNERIRELLDRRNRAVGDNVRGTSDGKRDVMSGETADFIRQARAEMSCARTKVTSSTTSRNDRDAERERQRVEEMQRIREAELRKREEEQREREQLQEKIKRRRNRGYER